MFFSLQCAPSRRQYALPGDPVFSLDIAVTVVLEKLFQGTLFFLSLHIGGQFITRAAHLHRNCSGYVKQVSTWNLVQFASDEHSGAASKLRGRGAAAETAAGETKQRVKQQVKTRIRTRTQLDTCPLLDIKWFFSQLSVPDIWLLLVQALVKLLSFSSIKFLVN